MCLVEMVLRVFSLLALLVPLIVASQPVDYPYAGVEAVAKEIHDDPRIQFAIPGLLPVCV